MKKLFFVFALALVALTACNDDDDDNHVDVNQIVRAYIETKYPGAEIRYGEYDERGLLEVEFMHNSQVKDAYFNSSNEWIYTEWDIAIADLPAEVSNAVSNAYPDFRVDDADYIQAPQGDYYEIEIEKGNVESWIYVTPLGNIVQGGIEGGGSAIVNDVVKSFIEAKYPGAIIRGVENSNGLLEVEFTHDARLKDAYFNSSDEWVYTEWDVAVADLPVAVVDAVAESYPDYIIDEADFVETTDGTYYKLDIEKGNFEKWIYVTPSGEILE